MIFSSLLSFLMALAPDAGTVKVAPAVDDTEVVQNLELLENFDQAADLDLLEALTVER